MSAPTWTPKELAEFDAITWDLSSQNQMTRIKARMSTMPAFLVKHGQEKCDAMWAHLMEREDK